MITTDGFCGEMYEVIFTNCGVYFYLHVYSTFRYRCCCVISLTFRFQEGLAAREDLSSTEWRNSFLDYICERYFGVLDYIHTFFAERYQQLETFFHQDLFAWWSVCNCSPLAFVEGNHYCGQSDDTFSSLFYSLLENEEWLRVVVVLFEYSQLGWGSKWFAQILWPNFLLFLNANIVITPIREQFQASYTRLQLVHYATNYSCAISAHIYHQVYIHPYPFFFLSFLYSLFYSSGKCTLKFLPSGRPLLCSRYLKLPFFY